MEIYKNKTFHFTPSNLQKTTHGCSGYISIMTAELLQLKNQFYDIAKELLGQLDPSETQEKVPQASTCRIEGTFPGLLSKNILEQCERHLLHASRPVYLDSLQNQQGCTLAMAGLLAPIYNSIARYHLAQILNCTSKLLITTIDNTAFPIRTLSGASLTMDDILTVKATKTWLNDEVINAQVSLINAHCKGLSVANTHLYSKVLSSGPYSIETWLRPLLVRPIETFVIPMNLNNTHWIACSIHLQGHFILCFDSMRTVSTRTIKPVLLLLLAHADMFGLTRSIIRKSLVVLFPGFTRTFMEIDEEEHVLEELASLEERRTSDITLLSQSAGEKIDTISISSTGSDAELSSVQTTFNSSTNVDTKSKQVFKKFTFQHPRSSYYLLHRTGPSICGVSNSTNSIGLLSRPTIDTEGQDDLIAARRDPISDTTTNIVLEILSILTTGTGIVEVARKRLNDEGLDTLLDSPSSNLLFVDVKTAEIALHKLRREYNIRSLLSSAAEAVMLSLNMPQQENGYDCGVYMLLFIKMIARQFGPGYPLVAQDTKRARSLIAMEVCKQKLLVTPQDLDEFC
ncbi:Sentrin specific protease, putative [Giardia lamblia P15]|uniref:Sentrin specific protease, putative n=1 Tax=Giardia intestinalis (strain P15) TaxID=658858 RepID=E1EYZ4_GIAIA|nr:Sentrin specific protease, putative [Giardia lamblia P15]